MSESATSKTGVVRPPLGQRISSLRKSKGATLRQLAEICEISEATMSRIERGKTDVSAHHLFLMAGKLGADIADFFSENTSPLTRGTRSITRRGEAKHHAMARYVSEVLSADLSQKDMHPAINHVVAESLDDIGGLLSHAGEEFLYVLGGAIVFHSEYYTPVILNTGDSISFKGSMGHAYLKSGSDPAKILVVVGPPDVVLG